MKNPKVSVSIITYNHAKFITQAIEGVLMQKTNFDYEIIIGEDDSTDGTREIVKSYKEKYPEKIRLFLNNRENVIYINDKPTGRWNFINNLKHAEGQYVALLDGDDYWISPDKLQKQVDFLDSHPECTICYHDCNIIENNEQHVVFGNPLGKKKFYTLEDLLKRNFMSTCSVMFRNKLFHEFPDWLYRTEYGDYPLHILNAQYGKIGYLNEVMSVYRWHEGGITFSKEGRDKTLRLSIETNNIINAHLDFKYNRLIKAKNYYTYYQVAVIEGNRYGALSNWLKSTTTHPYYLFFSIKRLLIVWLKLLLSLKLRK